MVNYHSSICGTNYFQLHVPFINPSQHNIENLLQKSQSLVILQDIGRYYFKMENLTVILEAKSILTLQIQCILCLQIKTRLILLMANNNFSILLQGGK